MKKKSIKYNTILNAMRMLLTVLVPLITFPYTSRVFLTEGSGDISFVQATVQLFTLFASLGIYTYGLRESSKVRNDKQLFSKLAIELFVINLITTIATYIVFIIMINVYPPFVGVRTLFLINGVAIGFSALGLDWVFGAYEDYVYITLRQIVLQIFVVLGMLIFVHSRNDIYIWMAILTISNVGSNVFNFFYARKYILIPQLSKADIRGLEIRKHIKPILILFATALAARVYSNLDTLLLGIQTTSHNVGLYTAAVKMNTVLITMFSAMAPVFMPRITESIERSDKEDCQILLTKIFRVILSACIPTVIGLEMVSGELIDVLAGTAFSNASLTMRILAPIVLVCSCANIFYYNVLVPSGKEDCVLKCTIVSAVVNLLISVILIPVIKENGAAVGSLLSETVALLVAISYCNKLDYKIREIIPKLGNYFLGSLSIIACCLLTHHFINNNIVKLLVCLVSSIFAYITVLLLRKDEMANEGIALVKSLNSRIKGTRLYKK